MPGPAVALARVTIPLAGIAGRVGAGEVGGHAGVGGGYERVLGAAFVVAQAVTS